MQQLYIIIKSFFFSEQVETFNLCHPFVKCCGLALGLLVFLLTESS